MDNLLLLAGASCDQASVIMSVLDDFCCSSAARLISLKLKFISLRMSPLLLLIISVLCSLRLGFPIIRTRALLTKWINSCPDGLLPAYLACWITLAQLLAKKPQSMLSKLLSFPRLLCLKLIKFARGSFGVGPTLHKR